MFRKVRKQLTWFNSLLTGLFLLIFAVITYSGIVWGIYFQTRMDIVDFAKEEGRENLEILKKREYLQPGFLESETRENGLLFFFVYDRQGKLLIDSLPQSDQTNATSLGAIHSTDATVRIKKIRQQIIANITDGKIRYGNPTLFSLKDSREWIRVMMVALPLREGKTVYGKIYVGKNITALDQFIRNMCFIFALTSVIFLLLATLAGFIMSGRAMEPIKRSYERQREFLADASHELRTPLSILLASVDAIQGDEGNQTTPFTGQVLADMRDEIKKMTKIVADLLTLARSDAAVLNLIKTQFDIFPVAQQIVRTMAPLAQTKRIDFQMDIPAHLTLFADRERIAQLLLILLDNAVNYTPENGKVKLFIQKSVKESAKVEIAVTDNGPGIALEQQALIFERFYRVDQARSREMGGTGLGLPIAKWIVEQHGGTIKVISQPGQGASFKVMLPVAV